MRHATKHDQFTTSVEVTDQGDRATVTASLVTDAALAHGDIVIGHDLNYEELAKLAIGMLGIAHEHGAVVSYSVE